MKESDLRVVNSLTESAYGRCFQSSYAESSSLIETILCYGVM